jgi:hypothetical protein
MFSFVIVKDDLEKLINDLSTWDDWDKIDKVIFRSEEWSKRFIEMHEVESKRSSEIIDGDNWNSYVEPYDVSPEILHLYETTRWRVYAILEPESEEENRKHPERYGKMCSYCRIWSQKYPKDKCPKCGNDLLLWPLND